MSNRISNFLIAPLRHPVRTFVIAIICAALAALGTSRIRADGSLAAMFSRDNPSAQAMVRVMNDFGAVDELLVLVSAPGNGDATSADVEKLTHFGQQLAAEISHAPETAQITDGSFYKPDPQQRDYFEHVLIPAGIYYLDDRSFAAIKARLAKAQMREQIRQDEAMMTTPGAAGSLAKALMRDPLRLREFLSPLTQRLEGSLPFTGREGTDAFISRDGRNLLVRVRGRQSPSNLEFCKQLTQGVSAVARRVNPDGLELRFAGSYAIAAASASAIRSDMISSVVGSVLLLQLLFMVAYRSPFKLFMLAFGPIALGILLGFGGYSVFQTGLTPMTAVLGGILAGMAIDYSIQYLSMYESSRDAGMTARRAAEASAVDITPAAFAAWATSVVGFFAIGASSVKALRDFSLLGVLGLAGAFLAAVALLPLLLMLTDRRIGGAVKQSHFRFGVEPLIKWIGRHSRGAFWMSIILFLCAAGTLLILPGEILSLESDLTVMHPRPNGAIETQNLIAERFGMHDWLIVHLQANSPEELVGLASRVDVRLRGEVAKSAGVAGSFGLATLLPDPLAGASRNSQLKSIDPAQVVEDFCTVVVESVFNPDAPEIKDYANFLKTALSSPPPVLEDLIRYPRLSEMLLPKSVFEGKPVTEAITLVFITGSTDARAARDHAVDGIRAALAGEEGATLTGLSVLSRDTERTVRRDLPRLSGIAVVIVLLYLMVHFRNLADALLAIAPTIFSLTILLAAMRLAGMKINMVNLIAAPLLIGIDVDYGIFLVSLTRVKRSRNETFEALSARLAPVCHAIIICAVATMIGYGSLMWTSVPAIRSLGFAVAVGIGACLFSVLFLLVPVFLRLSIGVDRGKA